MLHVQLTDRGQYRTVQFVETPDAGARTWPIPTPELESKANAALNKLKDHLIGGNVRVGKGCMFATSVEHVARTFDAAFPQKVAVEPEAKKQEKVVVKDGWYYFGLALGYTCIALGLAVFIAIKIALWCLIFPFILMAFKRHGRRH
jgi:hypothetical protein